MPGLGKRRGEPRGEPDLVEGRVGAERDPAGDVVVREPDLRRRPPAVQHEREAFGLGDGDDRRDAERHALGDGGEDVLALVELRAQAHADSLYRSRRGPSRRCHRRNVASRRRAGRGGAVAAARR